MSAKDTEPGNRFKIKDSEQIWQCLKKYWKEKRKSEKGK